MYALVVDDEEGVARAQLVAVSGDAADGFLLRQEQDVVYSVDVVSYRQTRQGLACPDLHREVAPVRSCQYLAGLVRYLLLVVS